MGGINVARRSLDPCFFGLGVLIGDGAAIGADAAPRTAPSPRDENAQLLGRWARVSAMDELRGGVTVSEGPVDDDAVPKFGAADFLFHTERKKPESPEGVLGGGADADGLGSSPRGDRAHPDGALCKAASSPCNHGEAGEGSAESAACQLSVGVSAELHGRPLCGLAWPDDTSATVCRLSFFAIDRSLPSELLDRTRGRPFAAGAPPASGNANPAPGSFGVPELGAGDYAAACGAEGVGGLGLPSKKFRVRVTLPILNSRFLPPEIFRGALSPAGGCNTGGGAAFGALLSGGGGGFGALLSGGGGAIGALLSAGGVPEKPSTRRTFVNDALSAP